MRIKPTQSGDQNIHFWGEPELGYLTIDDPLVLTRHLSMLTAAGINTFLFDQPIARVYPDERLAACENLEQ